MSKELSDLDRAIKEYRIDDATLLLNNDYHTSNTEDLMKEFRSTVTRGSDPERVHEFCVQYDKKFGSEHAHYTFYNISNQLKLKTIADGYDVYLNYEQIKFYIKELSIIVTAGVLEDRYSLKEYVDNNLNDLIAKFEFELDLLAPSISELSSSRTSSTLSVVSSATDLSAVEDSLDLSKVLGDSGEVDWDALLEQV